MGTRVPSRRSIAFASVGALAGVYELVAIVTDDVPTITEMVTALPMLIRAVLVGFVMGATLDHFITRRFI